MIPITFRKEAEADLLAIIHWYQDIAPHVVDRILGLFRHQNRER